MATFNINTITTQGEDLMATALANAQSIEFTGMVLGDGVAPESPAALTAIVRPVMEIGISKVYVSTTEPNTTILRTSFQNKTGAAFTFREAGIMARLKDSGAAPILYAYANAGDTADIIDTVEDGSLLQQTLICPIVTGAAQVHLIDNPSAFITRQDLTEYLPLAGGKMGGQIDFAHYAANNVGSIELSPPAGLNHGGHIDFHFNGSDADHTARIIEDREGHIAVNATKGFNINGAMEAQGAWLEGQIHSNANNALEVIRNDTETIAVRAENKGTGQAIRLGIGQTGTRGIYDEKTMHWIVGLNPDNVPVIDGAFVVKTINGKGAGTSGDIHLDYVEKTSAWGLPDYSAGVSMATKGDTVVPVDAIGYAQMSRSESALTVKVNGVAVFQIASGSSSVGSAGTFPIPKGATVTIEGTCHAAYYYPLLKE